MSSSQTETFCRITRADPQIAAIYINENTGDLLKALTDFYRMKRCTYVNSAELKKLNLPFKLPTVRPIHIDRSYVNVPLVEALLPVLRINCKAVLAVAPAHEWTPAVLIAVYISAVTRDESFYHLAKKFGIPPRAVLSIVLEVAKALNTAFTLPALSTEEFRAVAREFDEQTGFPRIACALTHWWKFVIFCDAKNEIFAAEAYESHREKREVEEKAFELLPKPERLHPDSKHKVAYRFVSRDDNFPDPLFYIPYQKDDNDRVSKEQENYNISLMRIQELSAHTSNQLNRIFIFQADLIPSAQQTDVLLSCVHLYKFMKEKANWKLLDYYNDRPGMIFHPERRGAYIWGSGKIDQEQKLIAEFMYEKVK